MQQAAPSPPPSIEKVTKKKVKKDRKSSCDKKPIVTPSSPGCEDGIQQAAATLQTYMPDLLALSGSQDLCLEDATQNTAAANQLGMSNFDGMSGDVRTVHEDSDAYAPALLKDSDIAITFDDDDNDKKT